MNGPRFLIGLVLSVLLVYSIMNQHYLQKYSSAHVPYALIKPSRTLSHSCNNGYTPECLLQDPSQSGSKHLCRPAFQPSLPRPPNHLMIPKGVLWFHTPKPSLRLSPLPGVTFLLPPLFVWWGFISPSKCSSNVTSQPVHSPKGPALVVLYNLACHSHYIMAGFILFYHCGCKCLRAGTVSLFLLLYF